MLRYPILSSLLILVLLTALNTIHASESLEYKLATINAGGNVSRDHITVTRFRSLLNQLSSTYVENKQQIADMSVKTQRLLKENGVEESLLNIMEGLNQLFASKIENQKYAEYATVYITLRNKGQTHSESIHSLQAILRELGIQQ